MGEFFEWVGRWEPMHWLAFALFCAGQSISGGLDDVAKAIKGNTRRIGGEDA